MSRIKNFVPAAGRRCALALITAFFAAVFTFAPTHEANAQGVELDVGFGWLGQVNDGADWQGLHFVISPGYRFTNWVGAYLDQGLGGLFWSDDSNDGRASFFAGQSVFNAKFFYQISAIELWGKIGIGALYYAKDDWHEGAFAFKIGIGLTYDVTPMIGIGANFDYLLGAFDNANEHLLDLMAHVRFKF